VDQVSAVRLVNATPEDSGVRPLDIGSLWSLLKRRKAQIIIPVVFVTLLSVFVCTQLTNEYDASTEILLEAGQAKVTNVEAVLTDTLPDQKKIESEIRVVLSRNLANHVINRLSLDQYEEFNKELQAKTIIDNVVDWVASAPPVVYLWGLLSPPPTSLDAQRQAELVRSRVIDEFLEHHLDVAQVPDSWVLRITFRSESPELAAQVANEVANAYVESQLAAKYDATSKANAWLRSKLSELKQAADASEKAVEKFRKQTGLLQTDKGTPLVTQQLTDVNSDLIAARAQRTAAEARLTQIRSMIRTRGDASALTEVLGSPMMAGLVLQEAELKRNIAQLEEELGSRHPRLVNARASLADLQSKIKLEVNKFVASLENETTIARAREAAVQRSLNELGARVATANTDQVRLRELEREADAQRELVQSFLSRYEETRTQLDVSGQWSDVRIISKADIPDPSVPSFPPRLLIVAAVFLGFTLLFSVVALGLEQLDLGLRSGDEVEQALGLRALGLVPKVRLTKSEEQPHQYLVKNPTSQFTESVRSVFTRLITRQQRPSPLFLAVTSALPGEGKTTLASCIAVQRTAGQRVLLVDGDTRRPAVHKNFRLPREPGFVDVLLGKTTTLENAVHTFANSHLHILTAGQPILDPSTVFEPSNLERFRQLACLAYDVVIFDTPPVIATTDVLLLASITDSCLLAVRWGKTRKDTARHVAKQLRDAGVEVTGVILNMVDQKKHALYDFSDAVYYSGKMKRYYGLS
jgi:capsular exopolysaccharide synthesis family protein